MCEHRTSVVIHQARPHAAYTIAQCTWGCGEYVVIVEGPDGVSREWAVSELIEAKETLEEMAAAEQWRARRRKGPPVMPPLSPDEALETLKKVKPIR